MSQLWDERAECQHCHLAIEQVWRRGDGRTEWVLRFVSIDRDGAVCDASPTGQHAPEEG